MHRDLAAVLIFFCAAGAFVAPAEARGRREGGSVTAPRLYEPDETVTAAAGQPVKFRWSTEGIPGDTHRYDEFRLFRGNQAYADAMIHGAEVPPKQGWIEIPAEFVLEPGIYCWTVRRVGSRGKTREAFSVFKVGNAP